MESIAIIGAGLAGLTVADALRHTHAVTVFEKSRGAGGRLSTRRARMGANRDGEAVLFDHGAPLLNPSDDAFRAFLTQRCSVEANGAVLRGVPTMNALVEPLLDGLDLRPNARVGRLERESENGRGWLLHMEPHEREGGTETGTAGPFDRVAVAIPAHQARRLVEPHAPEVAERLAAVTAAPCWTLMAAFAEPQDLPDVVRDEGDVQWLIRQRGNPNAFVLQMKAAWSRSHLERSRDEMVEVLLDVLRAHGAKGEPVLAMAHRWLYSQTEAPLGEACVANEDETLLVGGDWCLGRYADHAWVSGRALVARLRG